jgi:hypothetical protein
MKHSSLLGPIAAYEENEVKLESPGAYSQHLILFTTYKLANKLVCLFLIIFPSLA